MHSFTGYLSPDSSVVRPFHVSYNRGETYSGITHKPLHTRRTRFICMVSAFLVAQLVASIALVIGVAMVMGRDSSSHDKRSKCENCDVWWCAANCSSLGSRSIDLQSLRTMKVKVSVPDSKTDVCCVRQRDLISEIYKHKARDEFEEEDATEKQFDGIRVIDRWTEDDINKWPKVAHSSIVYSKRNRTFSVSASGTYFVHSRIDFNCSNKLSFYNQTIHVRNNSHPISFEDNRIHPSKDEFAIYTSSIDAMVELTKGEQLVMLTDPSNCTSPRSIVLYRLQDV